MFAGAKPLPPGQYSFNKDDGYQQGLEDDYNILGWLIGTEFYAVCKTDYF